MRQRKLAGQREMQVVAVDFMARSEAGWPFSMIQSRPRGQVFWTGHWLQAGPGAGIILGLKFPLVEGSSWKGLGVHCQPPTLLQLGEHMPPS